MKSSSCKFILFLSIFYLISNQFINSSTLKRNDLNRLKLKQNKVIVILADGIRYDYLNDLTNLKGFQKLASNGVKAKVQPIFPSNSYPNWYTILTGLYAEHHGMVNNFMYDKKYNETFLMTISSGSHHSFWWTNDGDNKTEPVWITAEKNGITTSVFNWVFNKYCLFF